jgi:S1-C subfamily serine protease
VVTVSAGTKKDAVSGSGFVASADGHIITNAHVITTSPDADAAADVRPLEDVYVRFADGNSLPARIVGYDLFDDIGVLKVDPARADLHPLAFGRAADLEVGEPLAVIGSPFGKRQEQSLSVGVVSAVGRSLLAPSVSFETPGAFQTDAAINHGNSGGPVFDARGRVVGVAAQIESTGGGGEGVGFAIPAEAAERSLRALVAGRAVAYAWLGVSTVPVSAELARRFDLPTTAGLLVDTLTSGGPAADAGLRAGRRSEAFQDDALPLHPDGDILTAFNGTPLATTDDLGRAVATARPGTAPSSTSIGTGSDGRSPCASARGRRTSATDPRRIAAPGPGWGTARVAPVRSADARGRRDDAGAHASAPRRGLQSRPGRLRAREVGRSARRGGGGLVTALSGSCRRTT